MKKNDDIKRNGLLFLEASMTNALLLDGLDGIKNASLIEPGFYYQAFFTLSIGIERLLKLIIIGKYRKENEGNFPENKIIKKLKHQIGKMVELYVPELQTKKMNKIVIEFIDEFAQKTRYYNLDTLTGSEKDVDPISIWGIIEGYILKRYHVEIPSIDEEKEIPNNFLEMEYKLSNGEKIKDITPIIFEYKIKEVTQEYNVLFFYEMIKVLVDKLIENQGDFTYPDMKEIFRIFQREFTEEEIRKKQDWKKEIN